MIFADLMKPVGKDRDEKPKEDEGSMKVMQGMSRWVLVFMPSVVGPAFSDLILSVPEVQELIKKKEKYDIILGETMLMESVLAGFAHNSKASIVGVGFTHYTVSQTHF